jgi:3-hydroxyisobutyrate dehydrogenase-like beta-hydroxyacid dehydrogenase
MKVGFIGLGAMGLPMTRNLLAAGHEVTVASRSRPPIEAAVALGATEAATLADLASTSEVIILCVPNSPEVVEVVDALLPALGPGHLVIDCSTIDPDVERAQHERVAATGARYLDGPLSGGTVGSDQKNCVRSSRNFPALRRFTSVRIRMRVYRIRCYRPVFLKRRNRSRRNCASGPGTAG